MILAAGRAGWIDVVDVLEPARASYVRWMGKRSTTQTLARDMNAP